jgi:hypothetical protein
MSVFRAKSMVWALPGALFLLAILGVSLVSSRFVFGEAHTQRPIPLFLALHLVSWGAYCTVSVLAMRGHRISVTAILAVGCLARGILLPSNLIQENDCYRYVLDGEALVHGVNPYAFTPEDVVDSAPRRLSECFEREEARLVLSRISYQEVPTIYPPLAQVAFAVGASARPWNWAGQRYVFVTLDVATMFAVLALLKRMSKPRSWIVVYAWNPLVLKEIANSVHLDSLPALCLVFLIVCLLNLREKEQTVWSCLAGAALAGAALAKLYALLLVPVCIIFLWRERRGWSAAGAFAVTCLVVFVLFYVPFLGVGLGRLTEGLRTYGMEWQRNDGAFRLLEWCLREVQARLPGQATDRFSGNWIRFLLDPRTVAAGVVALFALERAWRLRNGGSSPDTLIAAIQATLLCWFLFLPAAFPWYAVGLLAVSALRPRPWVLVLSGAFGLYYLLFLCEYRDYGEHWKVIIQTVEHGLVWLTLALTLAIERISQAGDTESAPA